MRNRIGNESEVIGSDRRLIDKLGKQIAALQIQLDSRPRLCHSNTMDEFTKELKELLNRHSKESNSNTPDFILANYIIDCLDAFDKASYRISVWYSDKHPEHPGEHI